jgi:hypothetical protein
MRRTHSTDYIMVVCKMGLAVLAPKDLVGVDVGVVGEAHRGWGFVLPTFSPLSLFGTPSSVVRKVRVTVIFDMASFFPVRLSCGKLRVGHGFSRTDPRWNGAADCREVR